MTEKRFHNQQHLDIVDILDAMGKGLENDNEQSLLTGFTTKDYVDNLKQTLETIRDEYETSRAKADEAAEKYKENY